MPRSRRNAHSVWHWRSLLAKAISPFLYSPLYPLYIVLLLGSVSFALLTAAITIGVLADLTPCRLCIWQRYPHALIIALALTGIALHFILPKPRLAALLPFLLAAAIATMLAAAGLAFWHVAIEMGYATWGGECANVPSLAGDASAVLDVLLDIKPVRCDSPQWRWLGISMAGWNGIVSLGAASLALVFAVRHRHTRN